MTCIVALINGGSPFALILNKPTKIGRQRVIEMINPDRAAYLIACEKKRREQRKIRKGYLK